VPGESEEPPCDGERAVAAGGVPTGVTRTGPHLSVPRLLDAETSGPDVGGSQALSCNAELMGGLPSHGSLERLGPEPTPDWVASSSLTADRMRSLFDSKSAFTVGLEEELMLLAPDTLELSPSAVRALELVPDDGRFRHELREAQLEIVTPVGGNAVAAALHLAEARLELAERLGPEVLIASAGAHPFSAAWGEITEGERYRQIAQEYTWAARGNLPCGLHVHVAVPGSDRALAVFNAARSFLPEIGALAANSPFLEGIDTGLASARTQLAIAAHRAGPPPAFRSWEELVELVEWGRRGGLLPDATHLWWDLRPHAVYGTLEFRVADTQTRVEDAAAIAAVCQSLVAWLAARHDEHDELPVHDTARISENAWRAARYGTRGYLVDLDTGAAEETRACIARLLTALEPTAERLGLAWALLTARALLADNGAERQRYVSARHGAHGLAGWLADETTVSARDYLTQRR
jgi:glutamate---cysteine ligase / carboxylate-amine ligase